MLSKNRIKFIRSLQLKKFRDEAKLFVLEGEKMVLELVLQQAECIDCIYVTSDFSVETLQNEKISFEVISDKDLHQISGLKTPNKALALCKMPDFQPETINFALVLDGIQDPGNMGTLIRLADWYGVKHIICSENTVDCFNPKVVQATMGSLFRVNISYCELNSFLKNQKLPVYGALLEGENIYKKTLEPTGLLVLGNEGNGISAAVQAHITHPITIPKIGMAESLNVSVAGAILLSEFFRGVA